MATINGGSPAVSVVIPAYANPRYVNQAIESIQAQSFRDFEIVLVDDCSGKECVTKYNIDDRTRLIIHDQRKGAAAARNTGIQSAAGRYVAFLDMDDAWLPDKLESQVSALERDPETGMVYSHYLLVDDNMQPMDEQPEAQNVNGDALQVLLLRNIIKSCSVVIVRREALEQCGLFNEEIWGTDDWDMWIRLASRFKLHCDPVPRTLYRVHPTQMSANRLLMRKGEVEILRRWLPWAESERPELAKPMRTRLAGALRRLSKLQARSGQTSEAFASIRHSVRLSPWDVRSHLTFAGVLWARYGRLRQ